MPFVKDTSYRKIPYSSETPSDEFHALLTVRQVVEKICKHQNHVFRCRSVGTVTCENTCLSLQELDDGDIIIRLSVAHMEPKGSAHTFIPPHRAAVQIFGFVHWISGIGPVMFIQTIMVVMPSVARALLSTMTWVTEMHYAQPDVDTAQKRVENQ